MALLSGVLQHDRGYIEVAGAAYRLAATGAGARHRHGVSAPDAGADINAGRESGVRGPLGGGAPPGDATRRMSHAWAQAWE
ncbi:hypothetical protein D8L93_09535 [Sodalis-like symbiont of Bactericera trigonica]|nr:hypothetical protein D8L93_09535 [Sodalis-like symbiont of Bactericera trigonica]